MAETASLPRRRSVYLLWKRSVFKDMVNSLSFWALILREISVPRGANTLSAPLIGDECRTFAENAGYGEIRS